MADVTDKDVAAARKKVDKLNEQIAEEESKLVSNVASTENVVRKAQLDTEAERLQRQLDALKESNSAAARKAATESLVEQVSGDAATPAPAPDQTTKEK
jgi:hypothetical protein